MCWYLYIQYNNVCVYTAIYIYTHTMNPVEVPPAARSLWGAGGSSRGGDPGVSHSWDVHRRLEGPVGQSCQLRGASTAPWRRKRWRWRSHDTTSSINFHHINNENDRLIYSWHIKTANFMWHCDLCWFFSCFFVFRCLKRGFTITEDPGPRCLHAKLRGCHRAPSTQWLRCAWQNATDVRQTDGCVLLSIWHQIGCC